MRPVEDDAGTFGRWLDAAIVNRGYRSARAFALDAGLDPSLVNRWIRGEVVPTAANLQKAAPALRIPEADLFAAAFPTANAGPPALPLPDALADVLDELRHAAPADRDAILEQVRRIGEWARYRRTTRGQG